MKKGIAIFLGILVILIASSGCYKVNRWKECIGYTNATITEVKGPNTASVNQEIDLIISYYLDNGCGKFESLETTSKGNIFTIRLKAKYQGCICTQMIIPGQYIYKFKAGQAGVYILKFLQPDNSYRDFTITVI